MYSEQLPGWGAHIVRRPQHQGLLRKHQIPSPSLPWGTKKRNGQSQQPYWKCGLLPFFPSCRVECIQAEWVCEAAPPRWPLSCQKKLDMCPTITPLSSWFWCVLNPKSFLWPLTRSIGHRKMVPSLTRYSLLAASHRHSQIPSQPQSLQL